MFIMEITYFYHPNMGLGLPMNRTVFFIILACFVVAIALSRMFGPWYGITVWACLVLFLIYWSKK